jgi:hypothetical protein
VKVYVDDNASPEEGIGGGGCASVHRPLPVGSGSAVTVDSGSAPDCSAWGEVGCCGGGSWK